MVKKYMNDSLLLEKVFSLLMTKLGPTETNRFINLIKEQRKDSVGRHREWQGKLDKDEFFSKVFRSA